jgi:hypothetical protein
MTAWVERGLIPYTTCFGSKKKPANGGLFFSSFSQQGDQALATA